jgi:hypothetical protein
MNIISIARRIASPPLDSFYDLSGGLPKGIVKDTTSKLYKDFSQVLSKFDMDVNVFLLPTDADYGGKIESTKTILDPYKTTSGVNILLHKSTLDTSARWSVHDMWHKTFDFFGYEGDVGSTSTLGGEPFHEMIEEWESGCSALSDTLTEELGARAGIDHWPFLVSDKSILDELPAFNMNKEPLDTMADLGVVFFLTNGDVSQLPYLKYQGGLYDDDGYASTTPSEFVLKPSDPNLPESNRIFRGIVKKAFTSLKSFMKSRKGDWIWFTT